MPKRRTLTKEKVVETAVRLTNEAGSHDAVSLTALAAALDIKVPSLYNHVKGNAGLQQEMWLYGQQALLNALREAAFGLTGEAALLATAVAYRRFALQNPGLYPLLTQAPDAGDCEAQALSQQLLQIASLLLASTGLAGDDMLHAIRGLRAVMHGFVSLETSDGYKMALEHEESYLRLVRAYLIGLQATP